MKITIDGFKKYIDKTVWEFPDDGVMLIEAPSGSGKSTIFKAVSWALFGKERNVYSWQGTHKKCTVQVEWNDVIITRQKNPERLTLNYQNKLYRQDEAQEMIVKLWGGRETWQACSYLPEAHPRESQRCLLVQGSSADKIALLEQWSFQDDPPSVWISKIQTQKKVVMQLLERAVAVHEHCKGRITAPQMKIEDLPYEIDDCTEETLSYAKDKLSELETNLQVFLKNNQHKLVYEKLNSDISDVTSEIENTTHQMWTENVLQKYEEEILSHRKYNLLIEEYEKIEIDNEMIERCQSLPNLNWPELIKNQTIVESRQKIVRYEKMFIKSRLSELSKILKFYDKIHRYNEIIQLLPHEPPESYDEEVINQTKLLETQYKDLVTVCQKWKIDISQIETDVHNLKKYESLVPYIKPYKEWKMIPASPQSITELKAKILELKENISKTIQSQQNMECPHCGGVVRLVDDKLVAGEELHECLDLDVMTSELEMSEELLQNAQTRMNLKNMWNQVPEKDLLWAVDYKAPPTWREKLSKLQSLKIVETPQISSTHMKECNYLSSLWNEKEQLQAELVDIDATPEYSKDKKHLIIEQSKLSEMISNWIEPVVYSVQELHQMQKMYELNIRKEKLLTEIQNLNFDKNIPLVEKEKILQTQNSLHTHQTTLSSKLKKLKLELNKIKYDPTLSISETIDDEISSLKEFINVCSWVIPWKAQCDELIQLQVPISKYETELKHLTLLLEKARWLEHALLTQSIQTLNDTLSTVLTDMFDDPIFFSFGLFTNDGKPTVTLNLAYHGASEESVMDLSRGELDRVALATTVALARASPFPYVMLDESFGSLDAKNKERCLECIKNLLPHKAVYIISHGDNSGDYHSTFGM